MKQRQLWILISGMMNKHLLTALSAFLLFAPFASAEYIVPEAPDGYVLDEAEILSEEAEATLEAQLATLEAETTTQIAVATLNDLQGYGIEEAGLAIGRGWGVGQEDFNNGVVFLVVPGESRARIEVGYGLEGAITDAQSNAILGECINYFVTGDYEGGILLGVDYLEGLARGEEFPLEEVNLDAGEDDSPIWMIILYLIPLVWAIFSWMSSTKAWWLGGIFGGIIGLLVALSVWGLIAGAIGGLFLDLMLSTFLYKKVKPWRGGGFWGGSGGRGGSSGGFGGFGGGSFGGGGATGRW